MDKLKYLIQRRNIKMKLLNQVQNVGQWVASKKKIKDSMIVGLFGGLVGTIAYDISNVLL